MGQITPNIGIYIPAAGETNYDAAFASGMVNLDQHDHSGGPNKGLPISGSGIAAGSITYDKLAANVADNATGIGTMGSSGPNQLSMLGILLNLYVLGLSGTPTGFVSKNGDAVEARTLTGTTNEIDITNPAGVAGNPVFSMSANYAPAAVPAVLATLPCFFITNNTPIANAWGDNALYTVVFDTSVVDVTSSYNVGTGVFTAPRAGNYRFCSNVALDANGGITSKGEMVLLTSTGRQVEMDSRAWVANTASNFINLQGSCIVPLALGETVELQVEGVTAAGTKTGTFFGDASGVFTWFSGSFIG